MNIDNVKKDFLNILKNYDINYILLSEYLGGTGGDLDIFIFEDSHQKFKNLINENNTLFIQKYFPDYENHFFYYFYNGKDRLLRIHVKYELTFYDKFSNTYKFYKLSEKKTIETQYGRLVSYYDSIILYTAKCVFLEKYKLEFKQIDNLKFYIESFINKIENESKKQIVLNILDAAKEINDKNLHHKIQKLRNIILPYFADFKSGKTFFKQFIKRLKRFGYPKYSILFLGPDGAGKTTTVNYIKKELDLPYRVLYGGLGEHGWFFKNLYYFREYAKKQNILIRFIINRTFMYILFPIELIMRNFKVMVSGKHTLLYIDRAPEIIVRHKLLKKIYNFVFPKPNLVILLQAPIDVLVKRKPDELDMDSATIKLTYEKEMFDFYKKISKTLTFDTSVYTTQEIKEKIEKLIMKDKIFLDALFCKEFNGNN